MRKDWRRPQRPAKTVRVALPSGVRLWALRWLHARSPLPLPVVPPSQRPR